MDNENVYFQLTPVHIYIQFSPRNQSIKCDKLIRKIIPQGNETPISRAQ